MAYQLLLFDFDGTLCNSHHHTLKIVNILAKEFKFPPVTEEQIESFRDKSVREVLKIMKVPLFRVPSIVMRAHKKFNEEISTIMPVEGIAAALTQLKKAGYQLGIVTSNSQSNVEKFLSFHNLDQFDMVYGDSSMFNKAKVIIRLLKKRKINAENSIYIGDETRDIDAAKAARLKVVSVTWGYNTRLALEKGKPDFLVETPKELTKLFTS